VVDIEALFGIDATTNSAMALICDPRPAACAPAAVGVGVLISPVSALLTDLYELTMAHGYFRLGMRETAVFELFVRRLPPARRFLIAAGLAQIVGYLEGLCFSAKDLAYLKELQTFPDDFLDPLADVSFTGSLDAMPEGTPFFADEPILRVTAPILEARLIESRILNLAHFQTVIASKAVHYVLAADDRRLIDFGMRRAHGAEAAQLAARASYLSVQALAGQGDVAGLQADISPARRARCTHRRQRCTGRRTDSGYAAVAEIMRAGRRSTIPSAFRSTI